MSTFLHRRTRSHCRSIPASLSGHWRYDPRSESRPRGWNKRNKHAHLQRIDSGSRAGLPSIFNDKGGEAIERITVSDEPDMTLDGTASRNDLRTGLHRLPI